MYGKIFESIYDGSLACGDWEALITFQQLIVLADKDGVVDMTSIALHRRTTLPLEIIEKGLKALQEPDPYSRSKGEEGRRIVLIDEDRGWGWIIVNYEYYRDLASREDKRQKDKIRIAKKRAKSKVSEDVINSRNVSQVSQNVADVAHIDVDVDADVNTNIKNSSSKYKFSDEDKYFAEYMVNQIKEINPNLKTPNINSWANEIRLMQERDNRDPFEIKRVFDWANNDSFWRTNILSPAKLRKQFDQLVIKSGANNGSHQQNHKPSLAERLETNRKNAIAKLES